MGVGASTSETERDYISSHNSLLSWEGHWSVIIPRWRRARSESPLQCGAPVSRWEGTAGLPVCSLLKLMVWSPGFRDLLSQLNPLNASLRSSLTQNTIVSACHTHSMMSTAGMQWHFANIKGLSVQLKMVHVPCSMPCANLDGREKRFGGRMDSVWLSPFAVHLKLPQHC